MADQERAIQALRFYMEQARQGDPEAAAKAKTIAQALRGGQTVQAPAAPPPEPFVPPPAPPPPTKPQGGTIADPLGKGLFLGLQDELAGGVGALTSLFDPNLPAGGEGLFGEAAERLKRFPDVYKGVRDEARQREKAFRERNPVAAGIAEGAGGLATGVAGAARAGLLGAGRTVGRETAGRAAALGAGQGAVAGFGQAEGDATDIARETLAGGAAGLASGIGGGLLGRGAVKGAKAIDKVRQDTTEVANKLARFITRGETPPRSLILIAQRLGLLGGAALSPPAALGALAATEGARQIARNPEATRRAASVGAALSEDY